MAAPTITSFSPLTGHVGTVITIIGTNFNDGDLSVYFQGTEASNVKYVSPTSIKATIAEGSTGYIKVVKSTVVSGGYAVTQAQSLGIFLYTQIEGLINITDEEYYENNDLGNYQYISINDIVNNFLIGYVGDGKVIDNIKRTDVVFHAKRGLQEFSYDILKTVKSQEVEVPLSMSIPFPKDYVNYVKITYVDDMGIERIILPTRLTSNPVQSILQTNDSDDNYDGDYIYDEFGNVITATSIAEERWGTTKIEGLTNYDNYGTYNYYTTTRYGLNPESSHLNGCFTINEREGNFSFSSELAGKVIILKYISDSLGTDFEMRVNKMAEEALYMHIAYSILASKLNVPEYIVQRFKKSSISAKRNAKIRLSNLKMEELTQVMRGKSKQIKH